MCMSQGGHWQYIIKAREKKYRVLLIQEGKNHTNFGIKIAWMKLPIQYYI